MSEVLTRFIQEETWSKRRKIMSDQSNRETAVKRTRLKSFTDHRGKAEQCLNVIQRRGPTLHSLLAYGDALCNLSRTEEALDVYATALDYGEPMVYQLKTLVKSLLNLWNNELQKHLPKKSAKFGCVKCDGVLADPVTILCGHSYCRPCYEKNPSSSCVKCGARNLQRRVSTELKTNVLMQELTRKWWSDELNAANLRNTGNEHFKEEKYHEAYNCYTEAIALAPRDHLLYGNRSQTLLRLGRAQEALEDATTAVECRPEWSKGHYRKGYALLNLNCHEEALVCFLHCAALANNDPALEEEIAKLLIKLLTPPGRHRRTSDSGRKSPSGANSSKRPSSEGEDSYPSDDSSGTESYQGKHSSPLRGPSIESHFRPMPHPRARALLERLRQALTRFPSLVQKRYERLPNHGNFDRDDFECTLCYRLLWQPVTTPCGHTFCKCCLLRCLDHNPQCPLCKASLTGYLEVRQTNVTEFLEAAIEAVLPREHKARHDVHVEEMRELASSSEIPIFICTLAFPTIPCPLHVFEPRYRLMIRRAMETGTREFGMCVHVDNAESGFADVGTVLEIRDVQYFPDGRSVVDTVGARRFRVLRKGVRDGYNTGKVEYINDNPITPDKVEEVKRLHDTLRQSAESWLASMTPVMRDRISQHFGTMPNLEADWISSPQGPAWHWWLLAILPVGKRHQLMILGMTDLKERLEALSRILTVARRRQM